MCGYYPSWKNINLAFELFKQDARRGAAQVDEDEQLVYADITTEDGYLHQTHLIDGVDRNGAKSLSYRDMNIEEWLHATGLLNGRWDEAAYNNPKRGQEVSASAPHVKKEESQAAKLRHRARFESGVLSRGERRQLSPQEAGDYAARFKPDRDKNLTSPARRS
jgi:hypothetical protein